jgi:AsmA family protein
MNQDPRAHRVLRWVAIAAATVVIAIVAIIAFVDWNDMRGPIERMVSARTGRPVRINGDLHVRLLSLTPSAQIEGLELGNLPWAGPGSKAFVDRLDVQMKVLPPRPFVLQLAAGDTRIDARGTAGNPFSIGSYRAAVTVAGHDLADLYSLTGLAMPNTPPYKFSAQVQGSRQRLQVRDLAGQIGQSDIRGNALVDSSGAKPRVQADLTSRSLNLVDLAPAFGAGPRDAKHPGRLFPDAELQVDRLRAMNGEVRFRAGAIKTRKLPLREVALDVQLKDGVLVADPFAFTLPQGTLAGRMRLDATGNIPKTDIDARITGVALGQFRPRNGKPAPLDGVLRGRVRVSGEGNTVHGFVSSADGNVTAIVPRGEIREAFAELTGINVARGLGLLITKDQKRTGVRCGVADFEMHDGLLRARNIVFDTDDVLIDGDGKVDLGKETFDLAIKGHPKKLRLVRLKAPIAIRGPLRKPTVGVEAGDAIKQSGFAAVLAAIAAPLAAVVAFVDPGLADDADCGALLTAARNKGAPVKTAEIAKAKSR